MLTSLNYARIMNSSFSITRFFFHLKGKETYEITSKDATLNL